MDAPMIIDKMADNAVLTASTITAPTTALARVMPHELTVCVLVVVFVGARCGIECAWHRYASRDTHAARCTRRHCKHN